MKCQNCKKQIDEYSVHCKYCGETVEKVEFDPKTFGRWSWGAFMFEWVYLGFMSYKWWWFILILSLISLTIGAIPGTLYFWTGFLLNTALSVYLGINGRKIVWKYGHWKSKNQFLRLQRNWDITGIIIIVLGTMAIVSRHFPHN